MKSAFSILLTTLIMLTSVTVATTATAKAHPCKTEHLDAKSACSSDKHSPECKAARKANKDCRIANGLPVHGKKNAASSAPAPQAGGSNAPAAPASENLTPATNH